MNRNFDCLLSLTIFLSKLLIQTVNEFIFLVIIYLFSSLIKKLEINILVSKQ